MEALRKYLKEAGVFIPPNADIQVHANTQDTFHVVSPSDPNRMLGEEALGAVVGGDGKFLQYDR